MKLRVQELIVPPAELRARRFTIQRHQTPVQDDKSEGYETMTQTASDTMSQVIIKK